MKLKDIHDIAEAMGRKAHPSGFEDFPDCRVINLPDADLSTVFVGIDIGVAELLMVERLKNIDGVLSHHPLCSAAYMMPQVARIQQKNWEMSGVDNKVAKKLADKVIREAQIEAGAQNHLRVRDAARFLKIPLLSIHTPVDNLVQDFFLRFLKGKSRLLPVDVIAGIKEIPECRMSAMDGVKPHIVGSPGTAKPLGAYLVDMTGGLDPPSEIFSYLKKAGIDTIVGMHYSIDNIKAIEDCGLTAIICGHMASDSIGLNLLCDRLQGSGLHIESGAGFYRVQRT